MILACFWGTLVLYHRSLIFSITPVERQYASECILRIGIVFPSLSLVHVNLFRIFVFTVYIAIRYKRIRIYSNSIGLVTINYFVNLQEV